MAKNDQQEAYEKLMSANHGRMMDFVKFAETKNAALLTFSSVWIGAIINLLKSPDDLPFGYTYAFEAALPLLAIAAVICLKSLLPRFLNQVYKREDDVVNLLYFGDIIKGGVKDYPDMAQKGIHAFRGRIRHANLPARSRSPDRNPGFDRPPKIQNVPLGRILGVACVRLNGTTADRRLRPLGNRPACLLKE
ncbi:hypothetical protein HLH89_21430 [Rhizobium laguerreae]|uniref:hypothetical protein n=1 Tax=Rhizobium laguerreae TaxID=1076926 RepID=UPI0014786EBE|nr:hypothetical protein [Rhizobium laguerreae]NNH83573.1 hypothetical protein [Rhizobium laguerreae]